MGGGHAGRSRLAAAAGSVLRVDALALLLVLGLGAAVALEAELVRARLLLGLQPVALRLELLGRGHRQGAGRPLLFEVRVDRLGVGARVLFLLLVVFVVVAQVERLRVCFSRLLCRKLGGEML